MTRFWEPSGFPNPWDRLANSRRNTHRRKPRALSGPAIFLLRAGQPVAMPAVVDLNVLASSRPVPVPRAPRVRKSHTPTPTPGKRILARERNAIAAQRAAEARAQRLRNLSVAGIRGFAD